MQITHGGRFAKASIPRCIHGHHRLPGFGGLFGDGARQDEVRRVQGGLVDIARHLDHQLTRAVLEQKESPFCVRHFDRGVDDRFEHSRQAQIAVEALVDALEAAQSALGPRRPFDQQRGRGSRITRSQTERGSVGITVEARAILRGRVHLDLLEELRGAGLFVRSGGIADATEKPRCQMRRSPGSWLAPLRQGRVGQSRKTTAEFPISFGGFRWQGQHDVPLCQRKHLIAQGRGGRRDDRARGGRADTAPCDEGFRGLSCLGHCLGPGQRAGFGHGLISCTRKSFFGSEVKGQGGARRAPAARDISIKR